LKSIVAEEVEVSVNGNGSFSESRRGMSNFWGKFKNSLIDIFKEEEDHQL